MLGQFEQKHLGFRSQRLIITKQLKLGFGESGASVFEQKEVGHGYAQRFTDLVKRIDVGVALLFINKFERIF